MQKSKELGTVRLGLVTLDASLFEMASKSGATLDEV